MVCAPARRVLQERADSTLGQAAIQAELDRLLASSSDTIQRLRSLWLLHGIGELTAKRLAELLRDPDEHLRAWAIQLLCENKRPSGAVLDEFLRLAKSDESPVIRLYLASAMQRLPLPKRVPVLPALLARAEDASAPTLPLMYWYATEPVVAADNKAAVQLLAACKLPKVRQFITRRMATGRSEFEAK